MEFLLVSNTNNPSPQTAAFLTFMAEQYPLILPVARKISQRLGLDKARHPEKEFPEAFIEELRKALKGQTVALTDTRPFVSAEQRLDEAIADLKVAVQGYFDRAHIVASLSSEEKLWMLKGMIVTRAVDNRMKQLFLSGEMLYDGKGFQGKGFRSLGKRLFTAAHCDYNEALLIIKTGNGRAMS